MTAKVLQHNHSLMSVDIHAIGEWTSARLVTVGLSKDQLLSPANFELIIPAGIYSFLSYEAGLLTFLYISFIRRCVREFWVDRLLCSIYAFSVHPIIPRIVTLRLLLDGIATSRHHLWGRQLRYQYGRKATVFRGVMGEGRCKSHDEQYEFGHIISTIRSKYTTLQRFRTHAATFIGEWSSWCQARSHRWT